MKKSKHETITTNLVKVRLWQRYSQVEIATILGIRQSSYNKMEAGNTRIGGDQLGILAEFYKIDVNIFYNDEINLNTISTSSIEDYERVKVALAHQMVHAQILKKRVDELEEKLERRNLKIVLLREQIEKISTSNKV